MEDAQQASYKKRFYFNKAFTLLELLIAIGAIVIVSVVVFLALDPLKTFKNTRNASRLSAVDTITSAINLWLLDNNFMPDASGNMVSAYNASDPKGNFVVDCNTSLANVPGEPAGRCLAMKSTSEYFFGNPGTGFYNKGYIPKKVSDPLDPDYFYLYITNGKDYEIMAMLESLSGGAALIDAFDKMQNDGGNEPLAYERGSRLNLAGSWESMGITPPGGSGALLDIIPPVLSNGLPTGAFPPGTTTATLSLDTNENATCRYSISPGVAYASMTSTFLTTGTLNHSTLVSGLTNGNSYNYYIRCMDAASNANTNDFNINFKTQATTIVYLNTDIDDYNTQGVTGRNSIYVRIGNQQWDGYLRFSIPTAILNGTVSSITLSMREYQNGVGTDPTAVLYSYLNADSPAPESVGSNVCFWSRSTNSIPWLLDVIGGVETSGNFKTVYDEWRNLAGHTLADPDYISLIIDDGGQAGTRYHGYYDRSNASYNNSTYLTIIYSP
jgi:competence protein ComGC